jgi:TolB-like protein
MTVAAFIERIKRLKGPIAAIAAGGAVVGGLAGYWNGYHVVNQAVGETFGTTSNAKTTIPLDAGPLSILVLPFANQTGDANKAYIADALTSSISADLNRIRDAFVVPTATAFTYQDKKLTVAQVGKDAGVRFVLQGGVVASGDKLRISAQLADTLSGKQLWNEVFDADATNMFELQDLVTARIGNSIGDQLVIVASRESEKRKSSPKVADLMMRQRALGLKPQSTEVFNQREALLRSVIQQEPDNAEAIASLARRLALYASNFLDETSPRFLPMLNEAHALAIRAKGLDDQLPDIYVAQAYHARRVLKDRSEERRNHEMVVKLDPKNPPSYSNLADWYLNDGQPLLAIEFLNTALALYPKGSSAILGNRSRCALMLGNNDSAIAWGQRAIDIGTTLPSNFAALAMAHANLGQIDKATQYAKEYKQRMEQLGRKGGIEKLDGTESPAYVKYYNERYLPEWRKAGLPE